MDILITLHLTSFLAQSQLSIKTDKNVMATRLNEGSSQTDKPKRKTRPIASENRCKLYPPEENSPKPF